MVVLEESNSLMKQGRLTKVLPLIVKNHKELGNTVIAQDTRICYTKIIIQKMENVGLFSLYESAYFDGMKRKIKLLLNWAHN